MAYLRTILMYLVLLIVIRLMGKRQLGQMEPSEFVVTMLIANLASIPLENLDMPLRAGLIPIFTILAAELALSILTLKSIALRKLLCGKPVILVENGRPLRKNLRRNRVTLEELMGHLRLKDVLDISQVQYAILETNGLLSILPYAAQRPPTAHQLQVKTEEIGLPRVVISDGKLLSENLEALGRNRMWLDRRLREQGCTGPEQVFLLLVDERGNLCLTRKDPGT